MTKVTVHDTSNVEAVAPAAAEKVDYVIDAKGRKIKLRKITPLWQSRIVRGVGPECAMNDAYMTSFVYPAAMVESIDGDEYQFPVTIAQVEGMLTILADDGVSAIVQYFMAKAEEAKGDTDNTSREEAAIKN